jgi:hypothetical protein
MPDRKKRTPPSLVERGRGGGLISATSSKTIANMRKKPTTKNMNKPHDIIRNETNN